MKKLTRLPFFIRLFHWEYWPFHVVYGFIYPYWFWLCLKSKSLFFFSTSNPTIKNSGFLMESKKEIYDLMPDAYYPPTLFFKTGIDCAVLWTAVRTRNLSFPLIAKPDIGMRGMAVKKLYNKEQLFQYAKTSRVNFLVQQYIAYPMEAGIFYYRYPNEPKGKISGIVSKEFLSVEGDGQSTLLELLRKDNRHILQLAALRKTYEQQLHRVLNTAEKMVLVPYGNHSRGARFMDASHLINEKLTEVIDSVCQQIPGFYYGRLDIRFNSWQELYDGKNFSIIELNGAGSEPTHIYDPKNSIFYAWKEIIRHLDILYRISKQNRQQIPFMKTKDGIRMLRENAAYVKLLNKDMAI